MMEETKGKTWDTVECPKCQGLGVYVASRWETGRSENWRPCNKCGGQKTIEVKLPYTPPKYPPFPL